VAKLKLKILREKLLIISQLFFGIPPFHFYAIADGIRNILSRGSPSRLLIHLKAFHSNSSWAERPDK
jgi:hypothetical protein